MLNISVTASARTTKNVNSEWSQNGVRREVVPRR